MDVSTRPSSYDLFKLIVAIVLLILFLLLLNGTMPQPFAPSPSSLSPTEFVSPATAREISTNVVETSVPLSLTRTKEVESTAPPLSSLSTRASPAIESTFTPLPTLTETAEPTPMDSLSFPSATSFGASTPTALPSPTATDTGVSTETPLPSPTVTDPAASTATLPSTSTATAVIAPTPTPIAEPPPTVTACEAASARSRLQTGTNATILRRLNFRSSPGIRDNWLRTNIPGTQVEVVGGPECVPYLAGAYVWWQIRLPSGEIGWSAEGSIHGTFYFMEPE